MAAAVAELDGRQWLVECASKVEELPLHGQFASG